MLDSFLYLVCGLLGFCFFDEDTTQDGGNTISYPLILQMMLSPCSLGCQTKESNAQNDRSNEVLLSKCS